jgi:hypothetical protein
MEVMCQSPIGLIQETAVLSKINYRKHKYWYLYIYINNRTSCMFLSTRKFGTGTLTLENVPVHHVCFFKHLKIRYRYIDIRKCKSCMFFCSTWKFGTGTLTLENVNLLCFFQHSKIRYRYIDINKCTSCMFFFSTQKFGTGTLTLINVHLVCFFSSWKLEPTLADNIPVPIQYKILHVF